LTYTHISNIFNSNRIALLFPPVDGKRIAFSLKSSQKEDLLVTIGRFEPERKFEDLIYALKKIEANAKALIIGFTYDDGYTERLKKIIKKINVMDRVELLLNADRKSILRSLAKAKVIVHTAVREPFGIAIVEGMASRCIPVVRQGFNGPWIDITERGKYGAGFRSVDELATTIEDILGNYEEYVERYNVVDRALYFDTSNFRARFLNSMLKYLFDANIRTGVQR
jgi:glycosyltransferase involved in cell wall biosynthesis